MLNQRCKICRKFVKKLNSLNFCPKHAHVLWSRTVQKKGPICCSKELLKNSKTAQTLKGPRSGIRESAISLQFFLTTIARQYVVAPCFSYLSRAAVIFYHFFSGGWISSFMYWGMDGSGQNFFYTSNQIWINRRNGGNTNFFIYSFFIISCCGFFICYKSKY